MCPFKSDKQRKGYFARKDVPSKITKLKKSKSQKADKKFYSVLKEHSEGKLYNSSGNKVKDRKQAVAIAYSQARKIDYNYGNNAYRQIKSSSYQKELKMGIKHESEHTKSIKKIKTGKLTTTQSQKEIAKDHLKENKKYYSKLKKCGL